MAAPPSVAEHATSLRLKVRTVVAAWADDFQRVGWITLTLLGVLTVASFVIDFAATAMGAKRVGASRLAIIGAGAIGVEFAYFFNAFGSKVALIEKHKMGGDCLNAGCVPSKALIAAAKAAGFRVVCYYFPTETRAAIARNRLRQGKAVVPIPGILGTYKKLEEPRMDEGFDELYTVTLTPSNEFVVEPFTAAGPAAG